MTIFWCVMTALLLFAFTELLGGIIEGLKLPEATAAPMVLWYWTFCCLVPVGMALYALRSRFRFAYGILELGVAVTLMAIALNSYILGVDHDSAQKVLTASGKYVIKPVEGFWLQWSHSTFAWFQIAAAIYVFVRGMDNVGEGLRDLGVPRLEERWRCVFPRQRG